VSQFVDGVSTVMRTVPALKDAPAGGNQVRSLQLAQLVELHGASQLTPSSQAQQDEAAKRRRVATAAAHKENQAPA
jgi:hypothetical protein